MKEETGMAKGKSVGPWDIEASCEIANAGASALGELLSTAPNPPVAAVEAGATLLASGLASIVIMCSIEEAKGKMTAETRRKTVSNLVAGFAGRVNECLNGLGVQIDISVVQRGE